MREIIFRGKDKLGHWLYGGFHLWKTRQPCVCNDELKPEEIKHIIIKNSFADWNMPRTMQPYEVVPETVGQYTGLADKNDTKIFEGDIVEFYFFDKGHKNTKTMLIEWKDSGFCMRELFRDYRLADDFTIINEKIFTYRNDVRNGVYTTNNVYFVEVIGNIHDNPELLESEVSNDV